MPLSYKVLTIEYFCFQKSSNSIYSTKQPHLFTSKDPRHNPAEAKNRMQPAGEDEEYNCSCNKFKAPPHLIDVPLLVTMAAWFLMLYVGITKFVKANAVDYESHAKYIHSLGSGTTYQNVSQAKCISDIAAHQSFKIVSNTLKFAKPS